MTPAFTAARAPDRIAVISERGQRTFGELNAHANQLVRALRGRGLRAGDAVALMCCNRPEFVEVYAAVVRAGLAAHAVNWHLTPTRRRTSSHDCEARAFVAEDRVADDARRGSARARRRASCGSRSAATSTGFESYDDGARGASRRATSTTRRPARTMLYTSGTTGRPKGVRRRPGTDQPVVSRRRGARADWSSGESLHLCTGPLYHAAPLAISLIIPLHGGVGVVLMDGWDRGGDAALDRRSTSITHTHMVPTMFHRLLALPDDVRDALRPLVAALRAARRRAVPGRSEAAR